MSAGVDLSQFFETFFDEADELLADMEQLLLGLDLDNPDTDQLNAIFRAAHSIKGGAGTFGCFGHLAETTHLLENLLDNIRRGEMPLRKDMIDLFLETKDVLTEQVAAYRNSQDPDVQAYERICAQLRELALEQHGQPAAPAAAAPVPQALVPAPVAAPEPVAAAAPAPAAVAATPAPADAGLPLRVRVVRLGAKDMEALAAEMALLGDVLHQEKTADTLSIWLNTTASSGDLEAVCGFIVNDDQVDIAREAAPPAAPASPAAQPEPSAPQAAAPAAPVAESPAPAPSPEPAPAASPSAKQASRPEKAPASGSSSSTIRVGVEKVDQIINLVGELVITQAMLVQTASTLDPVLHDRLLNGIEQLERNARDLQEAVMSIRMMPMDYVFSRFPRVVREAAAKMGKKIKLVTQGAATELDKSLIERIIDPLTHLVRNSIDHGVETPERRMEVGKDPEGTITMAAQHHGGQIVIEVRDDGAGLNREKILKKAMSQGFPVNESTPDEELWPLIFAPGFSTAEQVTEISGRGVGMDVV